MRRATGGAAEHRPSDSAGAESETEAVPSTTTESVTEDGIDGLTFEAIEAILTIDTSQWDSNPGLFALLDRNDISQYREKVRKAIDKLTEIAQFLDEAAGTAH